MKKKVLRGRPSIVALKLASLSERHKELRLQLELARAELDKQDDYNLLRRENKHLRKRQSWLELRVSQLEGSE